MKTHYFSHARTALKYGLLSLDLSEDDEILLPSYICDVILHPLKNRKLKFYKITNNFLPDWIDIKDKVSSKTRAIMMVNYFGKINDIDNFLDFAKKNNLFLIEDNAHGYAGEYRGELLGTFGDIGISSPRKFINIKSGGVLYLKNEVYVNDLDYYNDDYLIFNFNYKIKQLIKKNKLFYNLYKTILNVKRPKYESQEAFKENEINDLLIGNNSKKILKNINTKKLKNKRYKNYLYWHEFSLKNNLLPVYKSIDKNSNPWCFPAYVNNQEEAIKWFNFGWKNNIQIFSWPTLPLVNNKILSRDYEMWQKLICFSTNKTL